ncbi:MAG: TIGR00266 family protein [Phycisphaerales bacterium]|nr:TIGR00266 family protein [Phycisphaerales bacterium]
MPTYSISGTTSPFLKVAMEQGDSLTGAKDSMSAMSDTIDLRAKMQGGAMKSIARAVTGGGSFFMQEIVAERGPGSLLLSPRFPGDIRTIELSGDEWVLSDGSFLAADSSLQLETTRQKSLGTAVFGGSGGLFQLKVTGTGTLAVACLGSIHEMTIPPGEDLVIDNGHAVAWPGHLQPTAGLATSKSGGLIKKVARSSATGEGVVLRFNGGSDGGQVLVSSRSLSSFAQWMDEAKGS